MRDYFESYGEVIDATLMLDRDTGKSRGFGFITFKDPVAVKKVLEESSHFLDGKIVECKEAIPKSADPSDPSKTTNNFRTRKIFVGGLPHELTETTFAEYFSRYGCVVQSLIMKDRDTGKPRGFGFVTFDTEEAVEEVLKNLKDHKLMGKWVECKKATPSSKFTSPSSPKQKISPYSQPLVVPQENLDYYPISPSFNYPYSSKCRLYIKS